MNKKKTIFDQIILDMALELHLIWTSKGGEMSNKDFIALKENLYKFFKDKPKLFGVVK